MAGSQSERAEALEPTPEGGTDAADDRSYVQPELTDVQRRVLAELRERGIALVSFDELVGDVTLWQQLRSEMDEFVEHAKAQLREGGALGKKNYLIRRFPQGGGDQSSELPLLPTDSPWTRLATGDALLDVVNSYRGLKTKLVDFDHWYTIPVGDEPERVASQQWHRDPWDRHIVKAFVYFSDVGEEAGPFEYIPESTDGAKYGHLWPWGKAESYPPTDELERAVPESERMQATAPAGTIVLCDTGGFHRGGYARTKPRVLSVHTYVNRRITAGKKKRKFEVDWRDNPLSDQAQFALS
jgi:phytanoyl-CoA dioxygenase PhyH